MVKFNRFKLENGLTVIHHEDKTTPLVVVNTLYNVGARDENPIRTGFAHLFEHLMFGGSVNIPDFDIPLQQAGGQSNAFTSNDITNYYNTLPAENIETALWLESDRMLSLAFTEKSLEVQRNVVIEEFKQRYLNQPYGDVWLELRPLSYQKHPYRWATIGQKIEHIEEATMQDVKDFFHKHYAPNNAILTIAGNIDFDKTKKLVEKWYADLPARTIAKRDLPKEPIQNEFRTKTIERDVPNDAFYYAFKMPGKNQKYYHTLDLISDILGRGKSSRLYQRLKKELEYVSEINAFITGSFDQGLLVISGFLKEKVSIEKVELEIKKIIAELQEVLVTKEELLKNINKVKTTKIFGEINVLPRAMELSLCELLGDANLINEEINFYEQIAESDIQNAAKTFLNFNNCSRLYIKSKEL
jgi:predicted Zn-dependent peptidase